MAPRKASKSLASNAASAVSYKAFNKRVKTPIKAIVPHLVIVNTTVEPDYLLFLL